jgi:prepilin signal peptidase PulO-like enzyme (type II secretory pathway)
MMVTMITTLLLTGLLGFIGSAMGSFAGAQVWRLRARQLDEDKRDGVDYDKAEYKRLSSLRGQKIANDRSRCLSCGHTLAWYDLVPVVSWLSTRGKCRYCHSPIGAFEILMELGTAGLFALFSWVWLGNFGISIISIAVLGLWLIALTMFVILFAYDLKWFLLPDQVVFPLIGVSIVISALTTTLLQPTNIIPTVISAIVSVGILSGLYYVLWLVSKGAWVGFGDVKLGIALGVLLIDWKLALLTLFLANLIGTLVVLPGLMSGKLSRTTQVPFGPFLIIGFFLSFLAGGLMVDAYGSFSTWLSATMLML